MDLSRCASSAPTPPLRPAHPSHAVSDETACQWCQCQWSKFRRDGVQCQWQTLSLGLLLEKGRRGQGEACEFCHRQPCRSLSVCLRCCDACLDSACDACSNSSHRRGTGTQ